MKELSLQQLESLEGGKFHYVTHGPSFYIAGDCYRWETHHYFWGLFSGQSQLVGC